MLLEYFGLMCAIIVVGLYLPLQLAIAGWFVMILWWLLVSSRGQLFLLTLIYALLRPPPR